MNNMKREQEEQESLSKDKKEVYIDSNLFINAIINIEEKGNKARKVVEEIRKGEYKAYTSTLTLDEVMWIVQNEKDRETAYESVKIITEIPNLDFIPANIELIRKAIEIYKTEKLDPREAIHLASMKEKNISIMISSDSGFDKIKGIKRIDFTK